MASAPDISLAEKSSAYTQPDGSYVSRRNHDESAANCRAIREKGRELLRNKDAAREFARSLGLTVKEA